MIRLYHKNIRADLSRYTVSVVPKIVDHEDRRRQITDAVCRITLRGGLAAATFRQVAAEAGVSVRLVQHYFGTKEGLLSTTQQHVGERSTARLLRWIEETDGSPRAVLAAFLKSFIPIDDESRMAGLMYIALYNEGLVDAMSENDMGRRRRTESEMMHAAVLEQLQIGPLVPGLDAEQEASLLTALIPGLGQYVLDRTVTAEQAFAMIDYQLDRLFAPAEG